MFENMWKSSTPSKVVAFGWRMILNRISTRDNLALRNVLSPEVSPLCVMCNSKEESTLHLSLHCDVACVVWSKLMVWLNCWFLTPPNFFVHWKCWSVGGKSIKEIKGFWLIWHTTIWVLWNRRNDKIFKGRNFEVEELVEEIKVLSWRWMLERLPTLTCLFYEWIWNPRYCLDR